MPTGTGLVHFAKAHPDKYFDVGIAEEHAALFAAGLATQGFKPFLAIYSHLHAARLRHDHSRHRAAESERRASAWTAAASAATTAPRTTASSTSATCATSRTSSTCSRRTRTSSCDMLWTMANYNAGPIAIRYPRGAGTGAQAEGPAEAARDRQSRSHQARHAGRAHRPRRHVRDGRGSRARCSRRKASAPPSSTRAGSSRSTPARSNSSPAAPMSSAPSKTTSCTTASAAPSSKHLNDAGHQDPRRAHRLAGSIHRARRRRHPAQKARPHRRSRRGENPPAGQSHKPSASPRRASRSASRHD